MYQTDPLEGAATCPAPFAAGGRPNRRRVANAFWQPFVQFRLLMCMLASTALVAVLLGGFLYHAFGDLVAALPGGDAKGYYGEMIDGQLVHVFGYCAALFVLYVVLLTTVCVSYTHRLIGPLRPFARHVERLTAGDYAHRVRIRRSDLQMYHEYAERLNELAEALEARRREDARAAARPAA